PHGWTDARRWLAPDARVFDPDHTTANLGMLAGVGAIGGYDPLVPRRYGQFLTAVDGRDPASFNGPLDLSGPTKAFSLLRCAALLNPSGPAIPIAGALPRAFLVRRWELATGLDATVRRFTADTFDPARTVLLEAPPSPTPADDAAGSGAVHVED